MYCLRERSNNAIQNLNLFLVRFLAILILLHPQVVLLLPRQVVWAVALLSQILLLPLVVPWKAVPLRLRLLLLQQEEVPRTILLRRSQPMVQLLLRHPHLHPQVVALRSLIRLLSDSNFH